MSYTIAIAGHVDHGKTSLVKALTGVNTDNLKEEVRRELTIDLAFAHGKFSSNNKEVEISFVDVPGHVKFIKNMLAGTGAIDSILFVVAADDGIMPQTREHFEILRYLGVENILAVITKCDLVDVEQISKVKSDVEKLFSNSSIPLYDVLTVSISDVESIGYLKNSLVKFVTSINNVLGNNDDLVRFPIDRSFTVKGFGTVVTGTLPGGQIKESSELVNFKTGKALKIRGLNVAGAEVKAVNEKTRLAINLQSIEKSQIARGDMLVSPSLYDLTKNVNYVDCAVDFSKFAKVSLKMLQNLKLYFLSSERAVRLRLLKDDSLDKTGNHYGRIYIKEPICMGRGDKFILRDPSNNITIGGGVVLTSYLKGKRPFLSFDNAGNSDILSLEDNSSIKALLGKVVALRLDDFKVSYPFSHSDLSKDSALLVLDEFITLKETFDILNEKIIKVCSYKAFTTEGIIKELGLPVKLKSFLNNLLDYLCDKNVIAKEGSSYLCFESIDDLSDAQKKLIEKTETLFGSSVKSFKKDELKDFLKMTVGDFDKFFTLLLDKNLIIRLTKDNFILNLIIETAKAKLLNHFKSNETITAKEFRDILGTGRKIAIEILEYFDRVNITLRRGDERIKR